MSYRDRLPQLDGGLRGENPRRWVIFAEEAARR
jgi:hypothetical protein